MNRRAGAFGQPGALEDLRREVLMLQIAPVSREGVEAYTELKTVVIAL